MPDLTIIPITSEEALKIMADARHTNLPTSFDFAIAVSSAGETVGVIGMLANGMECKLGHLWTSGEPLVGSILYGAAWRCAKSLGYETIGL